MRADEPGSDRPGRLTGVDVSEPVRVETREGRVAYSGVGETAVSGDPPLVLLHGFTGHRDDWIGVMSPLSRTRRVLAPDLRGHGDSSPEPGRLGWSFEQLVADLVAFLDREGVDRIDLLGHSVGGFVALRLALTHPERIRSLAFLCTAPETPRALDPKGFHAAVSISRERGLRGFHRIGEKALRAKPFPALAAWGDPERYYAHYRRRHEAMTPASYEGIGTTFFESESLVSRLREVEQRSLVMVGAQDRDWLPGAALFEQHLPCVTRLDLAGAEHHPHQENRAAFLEALESHLEAATND